MFVWNDRRGTKELLAEDVGGSARGESLLRCNGEKFRRRNAKEDGPLDEVNMLVREVLVELLDTGGFCVKVTLVVLGALLLLDEEKGFGNSRVHVYSTDLALGRRAAGSAPFRG